MKFRRMRQLNHIQTASLTVAAGVLIPMMIILLVAKGKEIDAYMMNAGGFFGFIMMMTVVITLINVTRNRWW